MILCPFFVFFSFTSQQPYVPKQHGKQRPVVEVSGGHFFFFFFLFSSAFSTQENKDNHSPRWQRRSARSMSLANNRKYGLETSRLELAARTVKKGEVGSKPRQGGSRLPSGSATRSERVLDRPYKQFIFGLPPYNDSIVSKKI
jgi:hypothetical protein